MIRKSHVHARQARPVAVRLEQLGGLRPFDPPAAQVGHQLHEREVAHDPALPSAEPLQADHPDGPRPDAPFAFESCRDDVRRQIVQPFELEGATDADESRRSAGVQSERAQAHRGERRERLRGRRRGQIAAG